MSNLGDKGTHVVGTRKMDVEHAGDGQNLVIPADRVPIAAYQALYHRLTGRVETINRQYDGSFLINLAALEALYHRFDQAIQQYQVQGRRCEFTISAEEGENYRFTSIEKLQFSNLRSMSKPVAAVGVEFDFLVVLPSEVEAGENIPQRYRVLVTVEDTKRASSRHPSRSIFTVSLHEPIAPTGSVSISYADYSVGRNLFTIVEEWFAEIESVEEETISFEARNRITKAGNWLVGLIPLSVAMAGIVFEPQYYPTAITPIRYLLVVLVLVVAGVGLGVGAEERIRRLTLRLVSRTAFDLSAGDAKKGRERLAKRRAAKKNIALVFTGVLIASAVGFAVNYISAMIIGR